MASIYASLFFTVVLVCTMAYFVMGGLPLLVLAHDTEMDGRFVRRFFEVYYAAALFGSVGAAGSYALWGRYPFALGATAMAGVVIMLRRIFIPAMARLSASIQAKDPGAVAGFRKVHSAALLVNLLQLIVAVWGVLQIKL